VEGSLTGSGELIQNLLKNESQNKSYVVDASKGKRAVLRYEVFHKYTHYTLVKIALDTGRHHQIRCQMSHLGHPLKGDLKYGAKRANANQGICLHSGELSFTHPVSHLRMEFRAAIPNDGNWIQ